MNNKCQIASHSSRNIFTICLAPQCQGKRVSCQMCQTEFHKDHIDQLVDFNLFLEFIKTQSQKPSVDPPQVSLALQQLNYALKDLEEIKKLFIDQMKQLSSDNLQSFCKNLGNQYNCLAEQMGNQQLNELAQDLLPYVQSINGELIEKDKQKNLSDNPNFQFMKIFSQTITKMANELKDMNKKVNPTPFLSLTAPHKLQGHTSEIGPIDICERKNLLVSGSFDNSVRIWNLQNNTLLKTYSFDYRVYDVVFSNQGDLVAIGGSSRIIKLIEINGKQDIVYELNTNMKQVTKLNFSNDAQYLILGSCDQDTTRIWNVQTKVELPFPQINSKTQCAVISRDNKLIAASSYGVIKIFDFPTQKLLCSQQADQRFTGIQIQFSEDLQILISNGEDNIKMWSLSYLNQSKLQLIKEFKRTDEILTALLTYDSRFIITYCRNDKQLQVIDQNNGELVKSFDRIYDIVFSGCTRYVAITQKMDVFAYVDGEDIMVWKKN